MTFLRFHQHVYFRFDLAIQTLPCMHRLLFPPTGIRQAVLARNANHRKNANVGSYITDKCHQRRACVLVHNVLQNNVCHDLSQYFLYQEHCKNPRNNKCSVCLPRIRTECARKGPYYMASSTTLMNCQWLQGFMKIYLLLGIF